MNKNKHQYNHSMTGKPERLDCGSKYIKGRNKHVRRKTEMAENAKNNNEGGSAKMSFNAIGDSFAGRRDGRRRQNVNFERTLDFIGISNTSQQNNVLGFGAPGGGLSGLFKTMNNPTNPSNNFTSAAEAMGGDFGGGLKRTNSIFQRPSFENQSFHLRHNSVGNTKKNIRHFETETGGKLDALEESKVPVGQTFDERVNKNQMSIYNSYDANRGEKRRTHSMSFNFKGNPFHFRRTLSKIPEFMDRK